jgi:hypothetical protein
LFRVAIICIWSWKYCFGVWGGGIGIPVPWLFCPGCSAPVAGQNHAWCSPSDLNKRCMSKDIEEIIQTDMITFCKKDLGMIK